MAPTTPYNFAADVLEAGRARPDHPALVVMGAPGAQTSDTTWTHGALCAAVERRAGGLRARGLPEGARVMLRLGDTADFPITHLACAAAGLVPVPTSAQLTSREIAVMADRIDPALVVAAEGIARPPDRPAVAPEEIDGTPLPWAEWPRGDPERLGYVVFTSGSGGTPKAVAHAHRAVRARRAMWDGWYGLRANDRMLHAGAFNWTYTLGTGLLDPWAIGATALIPAPGTAATALPGLIAAHGATIFAAAPGVYRRLLRGPLQAMPALRHGLSAGEALPGAPRRPEGRWFPTGDLAEARADGAIRHLGRADDVLNPGGHRVSPVEVEAALADLPVQELAIGQRTLSSGATVLVAYYVGAPLDETQADAAATARLARYKRPRMWLRREALPRNANGKLIRRRLD